MSQSTTIVVFDRDLRLSDHPALAAAGKRGAVVPVYLRDPLKGEPSAANVWLHHALTDLAAQLHRHHSRLIVRKTDELPALVKETGADAVYWSKRYDPHGREDDAQRAAALEKLGIEARMFPGTLLIEPGDVLTASGGPYRVFTPFYRECLKRHFDAPLGKVTLHEPGRWPNAKAVEDLKLLPDLPWAGRMMSQWQVGERGASKQLQRFIDEAVGEYDQMRDRVDLPSVSRMSVYLAWGHISPRQVWHAVSRARGSKRKTGCDAFLRQLIWREFAYELIWFFPHTVSQPLDEKFSRFPWVDDAEALRKWQRGRTGYPIIDAAMHELWETGYMHNRARMIVASFLTKDLRIHWKHGADWFMHTLIDADVANNTLGWQWTAGCGADAAPYFRVFNPMLQQKKFDPRNSYVDKWAGEQTTKPIVDHAAARDAALAAYQRMKTRP